MKIKNIISIIIFITLIFILTSPSYAVLFGNREIYIDISNVENIENTEIYVLYPIEYIEYLYSIRLKDAEEFYTNPDKKKLIKEMKEALKEKDYINLIIMDEVGILEVSVDEKYVEYDRKVYVKANILPTYLEKESMEFMMQSIGKEYDENTICIPLFIDYDYTGKDFKFLIVEGENQKILSLDKFKYETSYRGVTDYTLIASVDYNKIDKVIANEEFFAYSVEEISRVYEIYDTDTGVETEIEILAEPEEKELIDIIIENKKYILIAFIIINLILITVLIKIIKDKKK